MFLNLKTCPLFYKEQQKPFPEEPGDEVSVIKISYVSGKKVNSFVKSPSSVFKTTELLS